MDNENQAPKVPFSELGQVDSDFALAKILQHQERAFVMLAMDRDTNGNDYDGSEEEDFIVDYDDDPDENDGEYLLADEIEDIDQQEYLVLEGTERIAEEGEVDDHEEEHDSQDSEPEDLSYEELTALGELVGKESRGLPKDGLLALPSSTYNRRSDSNDECVICQVDYEEGEELVFLQCKHQYHADCIKKWLQMSKVCPICSGEVSSPAHGQST